MKLKKKYTYKFHQSTLQQRFKTNFSKKFFLNFSFVIIALLFLTSCGSTKNAIYLNDESKEAYYAQIQNHEPIIQPNDLLSIVVSSVNPEASALFNIFNNDSDPSSTNAGTTTRIAGYLVDQEGFINFPILGKIKATEQTKKDLQDKITSLLLSKKLLIEPLVDIRILNYKVSVLGEVKNPSVLNVPSEKISIFEALGMAGDITIFGRRDNITIIRDDNGEKRINRIDLTTNEIFNSPYYYLKSNDIIYVQPNKAKVASSKGARDWIPVILSAISLAIITIVN